MDRHKMIETVGNQFLQSNIENGEFSYSKALNRNISGHKFLDIRFYDEQADVSVLIETKQKFTKKDYSQLFAYVNLEQELSPQTKIIAIIANTGDDKLKVWKVLSDSTEELDDRKLKSFAEYVDYFKPQNVNDKTAVLENTSKLNRLLHDNGIRENLRSQFVGTCLLAPKNNLTYKNLSTLQIITGIRGFLGQMLNNSVDKATKVSILDTKVLQSQNVQNLEAHNFESLLNFIKEKILPYINEASNEGQDILSYFFTTFNKYVNREDKNQAFTPNHIAHFMCKVGGITRNTRILDPTCGSGTFLVQAMTQALNCCDTNEERENVKRNQIFGIEVDENVYGLSTTNMLIHGDGNSNIVLDSANGCFGKEQWIKEANIDLVLMNPPYNASKAQVPRAFAQTWGKTSTDPSKGLYFVEFIADCVGKGRLVTLLPMSCAISTNGAIAQIKSRLLEHHTLDAVFSFPAEMFYPGASAVACCMVFDLGKPHADSNQKNIFRLLQRRWFRKTQRRWTRRHSQPLERDRNGVARTL